MLTSFVRCIIVPATAVLLLSSGACTSLADSQLGLIETRGKKEIRFVAQQPTDKEPVWHADTVLLDRWRHAGEDLVFVLDNPTGADHAFLMPGVHMISRERVLTPEQSVDLPWPVTLYYTEPVALTVKAGEQRQFRVHDTHLLSARSVGKAFPFFCSIHRDLPQSHSLYVL